mmetsp:Transcript_2979/g.6054  ORF Transcript_2979/g.6054 Transcript_2979/m.6054 type:complete len:483 (-) Transcript_2979:308-1756(-)
MNQQESGGFDPNNSCPGPVLGLEPGSDCKDFLLKDLDDILSPEIEVALLNELCGPDNTLLQEAHDQEFTQSKVSQGMGSAPSPGSTDEKAQTDGNLSNSKGKQTSDEQKGTNRNASRQRRYRQRKKEKEDKIKMEIEELKAAVESVRIQNKDLRIKQDAMTSMLGYNREALNVLVGTPEGEENVVVQHAQVVDDTTITDMQQFLKARDVNIGTLYADVLSSFQEQITQKDGEIPLGTRMDMFSNVLKTLPPSSMYQLFRSQIGSLLNEYDRCTRDPERQEVMKREMKALFSMRTEAIGEMAQKHPKIVLSHLTDGWVGGDFNQGIMPESPDRMDQSALLTLVKHLELTDSQISSLCKHWESFIGAWNTSADNLYDVLPSDPNLQEVDDDEKAISEGSSDTIVDILESQGMHGSMRQAFLMHAVRQNIEDISKQQVYVVLELAQNICTVLTPLQKARLCVFQESAPNCIYLPFMLTDLPPKVC